MAAACVKLFSSHSFAPIHQTFSSCGALKQTVSNSVIKSWKRFTVSAKTRLSTGLPADNAVGKNGGKWGLLPLVAGPLGANLFLVNNAGALDEGDAVSAYDAFVKGTTSVADTVTSDGGDALENVTAVLGDNAPVIGAVVLLAIAVPALISTFFKKGYAGSVSAEQALRLLEEDADSILIDIRSSKEISEEGSPKLAGGKKAVRIQFQKESDGEVTADPAFVSKVEAKRAAKDASIYVIDKTGSVSIDAAKSLTQAGFTKASVVSGGTDAWLASELPWLKPTNFTLDLSTLREAIDATVKENPNVVPATLGIAAATAGSFLLFSEAETALQLLGSAALAQLVIQKLLFAEDRKKTIEQVKSFLDTKVAPQELVDEIKEIGNALLPIEAAPEGTSGSSESDRSNEAVEAPVAAKATKSSELPPSPTPLSPYAVVELKPPASPTPAKP